MRLLVAVALAALLSGCVDPTFPFAWEREREAAGGRPTPPLVPPSFDLTVRVSQETADGPPLQGAEVVAFLLGPDGLPSGPSIPASTTSEGVVRFSFTRPTALALRATLPGWTQEGTRVDVGPLLAADQATVSGRDLFLPLYRSSLGFSAALQLSTVTVVPGDEPGTVRMPAATVALAVPDDVRAAYLGRLSAAEVTLRWEDGAAGRADLAAGLAWDGKPWVAGESSGPGLGPRVATYAANLPADGRPADLETARLQAAAVIGSAVVGDVPVAWDVVLRFAGRVPDGLPSACHARTLCPAPVVPELPPRA